MRASIRVPSTSSGALLDSFSSGFPDCRAYRRIGRGRWEEVRIEFEFRSRNFVVHNHDPKGCDLIVCWEHNWGDECPLEVIVLKDELKKLMAKEGR